MDQLSLPQKNKPKNPPPTTITSSQRMFRVRSAEQQTLISCDSCSRGWLCWGSSSNWAGRKEIFRSSKAVTGQSCQNVCMRTKGQNLVSTVGTSVYPISTWRKKWMKGEERRVECTRQWKVMEDLARNSTVLHTNSKLQYRKLQLKYHWFQNKPPSNYGLALGGVHSTKKINNFSKSRDTLIAWDQGLVVAIFCHHVSAFSFFSQAWINLNNWKKHGGKWLNRTKRQGKPSLPLLFCAMMFRLRRLTPGYFRLLQVSGIFPTLLGIWLA